MTRRERFERLDLPEHCWEGINEYIERGRPTGGFLEAVLSNNLIAAASYADDANKSKLFEWASFLYNAAPCGCYGSPEVYRSWIEQRGLSGINNPEAA